MISMTKLTESEKERLKAEAWKEFEKIAEPAYVKYLNQCKEINDM